MQLGSGHMLYLGDPDHVKVMLKDLGRIFQLLKKNVPGSSGKSYNLEKAAKAANSCRVADVIHPTSHTRMPKWLYGVTWLSWQRVGLL